MYGFISLAWCTFTMVPLNLITESTGTYLCTNLVLKCSLVSMVLKGVIKNTVKKICNKCQVIKRHGFVRVICENPKHKQRQG